MAATLGSLPASLSDISTLYPLSRVHVDKSTGRIWWRDDLTWRAIDYIPPHTHSTNDLTNLSTLVYARNSSFPGIVLDGTLCSRVDMNGELFIAAQNSDGRIWLGAAHETVRGGDSAAVASGNYMLGIGGLRFTAAIGDSFGFPVVCVGIAAQTGLAVIADTTVQVRDNGSAVTGAALTIANGGTANRDDTLLSAIIPAGHAVGLFCSAGSLLGGAMVTARFRRAET